MGKWMLKSTINYLATNIKFQNSEFQEDASPLSKQMKYAFPKGLAATQSIVTLNNETRRGSLAPGTNTTHCPLNYLRILIIIALTDFWHHL